MADPHLHRNAGEATVKNRILFTVHRDEQLPVQDRTCETRSRCVQLMSLCFAHILLSVKDVDCTCTNWSAEIDIIIYIFSDPPREQFLVLCSPLEQLESPPVSTSDARNPPRAHNRLYFSYGYLKYPTAYKRLHTSIPAKTDSPLSTAVTPADKNTPITVLAHRGSNAQSLLIPKNKTGPCSLDSRLSEAS